MQHDDIDKRSLWIDSVYKAHFGVVIGDRICEGYVRLNELTAGI